MVKFIKLFIRNFFLDRESVFYVWYGIGMVFLKMVDTKGVSVIPVFLYLKLLFFSWLLFVLKEWKTGFRVARRLESRKKRRDVLWSYLFAPISVFLCFFLAFQYLETEPIDGAYKTIIIIMFIGVCFQVVSAIFRREAVEESA